MCLAIPMKIIDRMTSDMAIVESDGVTMEISLRLTDKAKVGDYVLVHAGFALEVMNPDEALRTLEAISELSGALQDMKSSDSR